MVRLHPKMISLPKSSSKLALVCTLAVLVAAARASLPISTLGSNDFEVAPDSIVNLDYSQTDSSLILSNYKQLGATIGGIFGFAPRVGPELLPGPGLAHESRGRTRLESVVLRAVYRYFV